MSFSSYFEVELRDDKVGRVIHHMHQTESIRWFKGWLNYEREIKMHLNKELQRILDGKEGIIKQEALRSLIKYGDAMGAEDFVPITSAHTSFLAIDVVALAFPPRKRELSQEDIFNFTKEMEKTKVKVKTTINPGIIDRNNWEKIGATKEISDSVRKTGIIARKCGIISNFSCVPYINGNIPLFKDHCSWSETSAVLYINSILGARTNRDSYEISLYSALIGYTPKFGLHLDENRKGTDIIDVQCELESRSDWGALGYFIGDKVGVGIPVLKNLNRPETEDLVQFCGSMSSQGSTGMFFIPGLSPEAPDLDSALGGNTPKNIYIFGKKEKDDTYKYLSTKKSGKVDFVFLGCPHKTLYEIAKIADLLEGKKISPDTRLWIMTSSSFRREAEDLGYAEVIKKSGGELLSDGCLGLYYVNSPLNRPKMKFIATDGAKQAFVIQKSFNSKVLYSNTKQCIEIALKGGI